MSVVSFPAVNWNDIAGLARDFADKIDAGEYGDVARVALIMDTDHGVHTLTWGKNEAPLYWLGMFQAAGMMAFADAVDE